MSSKAAELVVQEIQNTRKQFSLVLPGGNSVTGLLKELAGQTIPWRAVNAFMADERLVPVTNPESNYRQVNELLFSKVAGLHAFPFEMEKGLADYDRKFMAVTKGSPDLAVFGVGEDGHIASLFPGHPALGEPKLGYIEVHNAPKPPAYRVSLSPKSIASAQAVVLLFASDEKKKAFDQFIDGNVRESACPAKIALKAKRCFVFTVFGGKNAE